MAIYDQKRPTIPTKNILAPNRNHIKLNKKITRNEKVNNTHIMQSECLKTMTNIQVGLGGFTYPIIKILLTPPTYSPHPPSLLNWLDNNYYSGFLSPTLAIYTLKKK